MNKFFWTDLVNIEELLSEMESLEINEEEKKELAEIAHSNLHHVIVDAVLAELSEDDKKIFLEHLANDDSEKIWIHLNSKVEKIEDKIKAAADALKKELKDDIKQANKKTV